MKLVSAPPLRSKIVTSGFFDKVFALGQAPASGEDAVDSAITARSGI